MVIYASVKQDILIMVLHYVHSVIYNAKHVHNFHLNALHVI